MAHPKRQHSKQRSRKRRTHQKIKQSLGDLSGKGNKMGYNHRIDPVTGCYKGRKIVEVGPRKAEEAGAGESSGKKE